MLEDKEFANLKRPDIIITDDTILISDRRIIRQVMYGNHDFG